jgi:hypothetical protein
MISTDKIIKEFHRIKELGFIKSNRPNNTGIGKTFEDYLGVKENNLKDADFENFEVKSQRGRATSYITLFTIEPTYPKNSIDKIRLEFGKNDKIFTNLKVIHSSIFANRFNNFNKTHGFKLQLDFGTKRMFILIKDLLSENLISQEIYWSFDSIKAEKLKNTFVVWADNKIIEEQEYFHYTKAKILLNFKFENFLNLLQDGLIMFDIRYGSYKTGSKIGQPHNHGCGFRIQKKNLHLLFDEHFDVE